VGGVARPKCVSAWVRLGHQADKLCFGLYPRPKICFRPMVVKSEGHLGPTSKVKFLHLTRKLYQPGRKKRFRPGLVAISAWSTRPNPLIEFAGGKNKAKKAP